MARISRDWRSTGRGGAADGEVQAWQLADDELRLALHDEVKILREEIREMKVNRVA